MGSYRWNPDCEGSKGRGLVKSRRQPEALESTPRDVVRPDRLQFDLRWDLSRSLLCFGFDDDCSVDGGTLVVSYCCGVDGDGDAIRDD